MQSKKCVRCGQSLVFGENWTVHASIFYRKTQQPFLRCDDCLIERYWCKECLGPTLSCPKCFRSGYVHVHQVVAFSKRTWEEVVIQHTPTLSFKCGRCLLLPEQGQKLVAELHDFYDRVKEDEEAEEDSKIYEERLKHDDPEHWAKLQEIIQKINSMK